MSLYLDYNASAPIDPRVVDDMMDVYKNYIGNADSRTHDYGDKARQRVEESRAKVAHLLGVNPDEVFFTSGATESNNIAIQGLEQYSQESKKKTIVTTSIEHKAVLETAKSMKRRGMDLIVLNPDCSGKINPDELLQHVNDRTLLVSVMHVNNETGVIQPVDAIGEALYERNILFHVDATQSCGKLVDEIRNLKYNMLSFSAHKLRGPQGIGALVLRKKDYVLPPVKPIMFGGQQEYGISPGTVPVALISGLGKACELAEREYKDNSKKNKKLQDLLILLLNDSGLKYTINGNLDCIIPCTLNIELDGVASEALMIASKGFCSISNGSACTSKSYSPSYVLQAMGIENEQIENSIRISWGPDVDEGDFKYNIMNLLKIAKEMF